MSIEKRSSDPEIDYRYPDEHTDSETDGYAQSGSSTTGKGSQRNMAKQAAKKKMIIWIGVGIMLFIVYQVLTPPTEETTGGEPKVQMAETPKQAKPGTTGEVKQHAPVVQKKPVVELMPAHGGGVNRGQATQLEGQVQNLSKEVTELKQTLTTLVGTLEVMATQVQELRQAQQVSPSTFMPFKPKQPYHLTAVIHGRAWLESKDGHLITVKEGDVIPEYGTIEKIEHNEGWVSTSSGVVITYGKNDS